MESPAFFLEHKKLLFHSHFNLVVSSYMLDAFSLFLDFNFFFFLHLQSPLLQMAMRWRFGDPALL